MTTNRTIAIVLAAVAATAGLAQADWVPGDGHKMHYPQLPDPFGWDVNATHPKVLADDWRCSQSGPVSDVHLWGSWKRGQEGQIRKIHLSIHDNVPETATSPSMPGDLLWERDFGPDQFKMRDGGTGEQGWHDPNLTGPDAWVRPDHNMFHQINIVNIDKPFPQERGKIYWLDVWVELEPSPVETMWGWKTSRSKQFMDDAVWADDFAGGFTGWKELVGPDGNSLDLAFVITPEPGTAAVLGAGGLLALFRRRRRK